MLEGKEAGPVAAWLAEHPEVEVVCRDRAVPTPFEAVRLGAPQAQLVADEVGAFWSGFDDDYGFLGEGIVAVVQALLVEPGIRRLDRRIAD